ncbi:calpain-3-like isoform X2 [Pristis pectinata]|uniref:calpain-3-like isoform X2 n=1 Tax=Pristis pectinata TaxID=685728 RepID=UPI00223D6D47|nr:calpain-3-like isoform X2 [Pristis pectinata]
MSPTTVQTWQSWGYPNNSTEGTTLPTSPPVQSAELDAAGLQRVLNEVFLCDERPSEGFSLDHCRAMALLINFNSLGRLNKQDFRRFWEKIEALKDLFHERDVEGSGLLDLTGLFDCLYDMGYPASRSAQKLIALRYADPLGRMSLMLLGWLSSSSLDLFLTLWKSVPCHRIPITLSKCRKDVMKPESVLERSAGTCCQRCLTG